MTDLSSMTRAELIAEIEETRRQNAESERLHSEELCFPQSQLDLLPTPIFYKDTAGVYFACNRAFEEFLHLSKEQIVGRTAEDIAPSDLASTYKEKDRLLLEDGGIQQYTHQVHDSDGNIKYVQFYKSVLRGEQGKIAGIIGQIFDVTEYQQAKEELEKEQNFLRDLLNTISDPVFVKDIHGTYLICNPAFAAFTGKSVEEMVGMSDIEIYPDETANFFRTKDKEAMRAGKGIIFEEKIDHPGGQLATWETIKSPFFSSDGSLLGTIGIGRDITDRKIMETQIRESEKRYRLLAQNVKDVIAIFDEKFQITYTSPSITALLGYTTEEILEVPMDKLLAPGSIKKVKEGFRARKTADSPEETGETSRYWELQCYHKDGSIIWVETVTSSMWDDNGNLAGTIGVSRDISERKRIEKELQDSQERYRSLFENAGDVILVYNAHDGHFLDSNLLATKKMGYSQEEFRTMSIWDINVGVHAGKVADRLNKLLEKGSLAFETEYRSKAGKRIPVEVHSHLVPYGDGQAVLSVVRDITERKEAQRALEESEKRFRVIFESSPISLWEEDCSAIKAAIEDLQLQGVGDIGSYLRQRPALTKEIANLTRTVSFNPASVNLFEARDAEDLLVNVDQVLAEESLEVFIDVVVGLTQGNYSMEYVNNYSTLKGKKIIAKVTCGVVPGYESSWGRVLVSRVDITELQEARQQAELANRSKSLFLAHMSHDLRTPVNGIMGMLQILKLESFDAKQKEYVDIGIQSCKRLTQLLSDILDISKIEAGKLSVARESFNLKSVLQGVQDLFTLTANGQGLHLSFRCVAGVPEELLGDDHRLTQVLANIVSNALKYTPKGEVKVEISCPHRRQDEVILLMVISDTGIGIADKDIPNLFDPFSQAVASSSVHGAGLGLAIAKELVLLMGGGICVSSEEGQGSSFFISLPFCLANKAENISLPTGASPQELFLAPFKALVVEDDDISRVVLSTMLQNLGGDVQGVASGEDALTEIKNHAFDIIFMDGQLPGMGGIEVTKIIRSSPAFKNRADVPVIAVTANAMTGDKENFMQAGMNDYLAKPVDLQGLEAILERLFPAG